MDRESFNKEWGTQYEREKQRDSEDELCYENDFESDTTMNRDTYERNVNLESSVDENVSDDDYLMGKTAHKNFYMHYKNQNKVNQLRQFKQRQKQRGIIKGKDALCIGKKRGPDAYLNYTDRTNIIPEPAGLVRRKGNKFDINIRSVSQSVSVCLCVMCYVSVCVSVCVCVSFSLFLFFVALMELGISMLMRFQKGLRAIRK